MSDIRVDIEQLQKLAAVMEESARIVADRKDKWMKKINALDWEIRKDISLTQDIEDCKRKLERLEKLYWAHTDFLKHAIEEYSKCEQDVLEMVEALPYLDDDGNIVYGDFQTFYLAENEADFGEMTKEEGKDIWSEAFNRYLEGNNLVQLWDYMSNEGAERTLWENYRKLLSFSLNSSLHLNAPLFEPKKPGPDVPWYVRLMYWDQKIEYHFREKLIQNGEDILNSVLHPIETVTGAVGGIMSYSEYMQSRIQQNPWYTLSPGMIIVEDLGKAGYQYVLDFINADEDTKLKMIGEGGADVATFVATEGASEIAGAKALSYLKNFAKGSNKVDDLIKLLTKADNGPSAKPVDATPSKPPDSDIFTQSSKAPDAPSTQGIKATPEGLADDFEAVRKPGTGGADASGYKRPDIKDIVVEAVANGEQAAEPINYSDDLNRSRTPDIMTESKDALKCLDEMQVPSIRNGEFNKWFNELTVEEFEAIWSNKELRKQIENRLRHPGGLHEWHLVSRSDVFKRWGVTAEQIKDLRTTIENVKFVNPPGIHGGLGSTKAHNELLKIIDHAADYESFKKALREWAEKRLDGGIGSLPDGLR